MPPRPVRPRPASDEALIQRRLLVMAGLFLLGGMVLAARFFQLQVIEHQTYRLLASDEHALAAALLARRGTISVRDARDATLYPLALDREAWLVYAMPKNVKDAAATARTLADLLHQPEADLEAKLSSTGTAYAVLAKDVPLETINAIQRNRWSGIGVSKRLVRDYPETDVGGHVLGLVSQQDQRQRKGVYGVEGYYDQTLAGEPGSIVAEKDAFGRRLALGTTQFKQAKNGSDLVLTLDRTIQYTACQKIREAVRHFQATRGSIVILDPYNGAVFAMCATPDFTPGDLSQVTDVSVFTNPVTVDAYEPGSIFKAVTIAAGIDAGKINPQSTFVDTGSTVIDGFTIHDSDHRAHGLQSMTQVLDESLNLGTIYIERQIGRQTFRDYVQRFGFGQKTNIDVQSEARGNVSALDQKGEIFSATASFGQGIAVTPLQMAVAYAAIANGGFLPQPHVVSDIIHPDGVDQKPALPPLHRMIDDRTARLVTAMMIDVVEHGHGKHAGVPGYYVAGKTGTAQIPDPHGHGYLKDATIGTFAGYAPANHPKFVMVVKLDQPKTVQFAESSAAPVFGDMARFLLSYFQIPPERPLPFKKDVQATPSFQSTSSSALH